MSNIHETYPLNYLVCSKRGCVLSVGVVYFWRSREYLYLIYPHHLIKTTVHWPFLRLGGETLPYIVCVTYSTLVRVWPQPISSGPNFAVNKLTFESHLRSNDHIKCLLVGEWCGQFVLMIPSASTSKLLELWSYRSGGEISQTVILEWVTAEWEWLGLTLYALNCFEKVDISYDSIEHFKLWNTYLRIWNVH